MKRPQIVHFITIISDDFISLKAAIGLTRKTTTLQEPGITPISSLENDLASFPIQSFNLLNSHNFQIKIIGLDKNHKILFEKEYETDAYGNLNFKIPLTKDTSKIKSFQLYETSRLPQVELLLGSFIPLKIQSPRKIVICDFDKTLVDTKYSTTKEVYESLTKPLKDFPNVKKSIELLKSYTKKGFHPFILSASPHFYENAIRDWLYQNKIFTAGIFLKDVRQVFSLWDGDLSPRDITHQGLYKLNQLLDIINMTDIPDELVLMGDNFESDPIIYLSFSQMIQNKEDPWVIWKNLKEQKDFSIGRKQNSKFLSKIFQIKTLLKNKKQKNNQFQIKLKIFIRKKHTEEKLKIPSDLKPEVTNIETYATETSAVEFHSDNGRPK
ncbi:MAG: hypothetical protein CME68_00510 [Halobacteriovoraceae bacterium]|nr:hypothetical protein [Halobacteriovoraceae bacterium]